MLIGGLQKMTLIDYPGKVAATIFTIGCNFRCHFCHNPELVLTEPLVENAILHEDEVINFLTARKNLLEAVCLTGGEPTLQKDLAQFIKKIKDLGYLVKLDTNGTNPQLLQKLIDQKLIDYVAMDIKAPWSGYEKVIGKKFDLAKIKKSVKILMAGKIPFEFRSTILPALHSKEDIIKMARQIKGAPVYYLQKFQPAPSLVNNEFLQQKKFTYKELDELKKQIKPYFAQSDIR